MKIIFLDIDGVLNVAYPKRDKYGRHFHPHLVDNLSYIISKTNAKIVISSTWKSKGLDTLQQMWIDRNLPGEVIDITPFCDQVTKDNGIEFFDDVKRGHEIQYWLDRHPEVSNFVIIDDDSDMMDFQMNNFVHTYNNQHHTDSVDRGYGLTKICADMAIQILND